MTQIDTLTRIAEEADTIGNKGRRRLWGLGYGAVPVALQTWIGRADPAALEAGSSLYLTAFQGSIASGSLLGPTDTAITTPTPVISKEH